MACRDKDRCATAASQIRTRAPGATIESAVLDLADLDSVRACAEEFRSRHESLDILVNNAGVMAPPDRLETKQGFELQFGTNHLGHFALTGLLLPLLLETPESRIVTVSSFAHEAGRIDFDDLQCERSYTPYGAYSQSKLANILFMLELDRRLRTADAGALSAGAHPGVVSTNLQAAGPFTGRSPLSSRIILAGVRLIGQSQKRGAESQLYAATARGVVAGGYYGPKHRGWGHVADSSMAPQARDAVVAVRLWDVSEQLTGVEY